MMLRKALMAVAAVASLSLFSPIDASARGGFGGGGFHGGGFHGGGGFRGGGWRGGGFGPALGIGVGLGLAGAYGGYGYPYGGYGYPASYAYYGDEGGCYLVRRRVMTNYGWRVRPVRVCGY